VSTPDFDATKARVEKTDRAARRMLAACLIFAVVLIVAASIALGFALQRLHSDVTTLKARQVDFHSQNLKNEHIIECQNKVFDQILAELPELVAGRVPVPIKKGDTC
jgi:hypothetical protein